MLNSQSSDYSVQATNMLLTVIVCFQRDGGESNIVGIKEVNFRQVVDLNVVDFVGS